MTGGRPYRWQPPEDGAPDLFAGRYPDTSVGTPPPELGWRARRRWRADAHRRRRHATTEQVRSWRRIEPDLGLGVALLVAAVAFAAWMFWPTTEPAPAPPDRPTAGLPADPSRVAPSPSRANEEAPGLGTDAGDQPPPGPPGLFDDQVGADVQRFVLAYATYSPAVPDPVDVWIGTWEQWATDQLVEQARASAATLWDFTVQQGVHVVDATVTSGTRDGDTWQLRVERRLFPVGGDETTGTQPDTVTVTVATVDGQVAVAAIAR